MSGGTTMLVTAPTTTETMYLCTKCGAIKLTTHETCTICGWVNTAVTIKGSLAWLLLVILSGPASIFTWRLYGKKIGVVFAKTDFSLGWPLISIFVYLCIAAGFDALVPKNSAWFLWVLIAPAWLIPTALGRYYTAVSWTLQIIKIRNLRWSIYRSLYSQWARS